ncbi:hypothetical protein ACFL0Q_06895, partial [Thermodesulfobacteriota bacterium]
SGIFQDSVSEIIKQKERFRDRIRGEATVEEIVERLRKEKQEEESDYFGRGKEDGFKWAKAASYKQLKHATSKWKPLRELVAIETYDPTADEILGDYFGGILAANPELNFDQHDLKHAEFYEAWEAGWIEAVREFWGEIEGKL